MTSTSDTDSSTLKTGDRPTGNQQVISWIIRRRVRITSCAFMILVGVSIVNGARPHDLLDYHEAESIVGLAFVLTGLALRSWAAGTLHKSSTLTTVGPYSLSRNPLYVGSFMMMLGFGALIDQPQVWIALGPLLVLFFYTVKREESLLAGRYGRAWDDYAKATPRFIPRRLMPARAGGWSRQQWIGNREYQAVGAASLGLAALLTWQRT